MISKEEYASIERRFVRLDRKLTRLETMRAELDEIQRNFPETDIEDTRVYVLIEGQIKLISDEFLFLEELVFNRSR